METTDDLVTSAGDPGSDRPPAQNTKAGRARLYRERRKHDLSVEQLEDARKKNRDRQKRFRDRKREQKRGAPGHFTQSIHGHLADLLAGTLPLDLAAGQSMFAPASSGTLAGVLQQEAAPSTAPAAAHIPGISSNDAPPEVKNHAGNAEAVPQANDREKLHAVIGQQPSMALSDTSLKAGEDLQAGEDPFQEQRSTSGSGLKSAGRGQGPKIDISEEALPDLILQGANLGCRCLDSCSSLAADEQVILLRALLSKLKEGLAHEVWSLASFAVLKPDGAQQSFLSQWSPGRHISNEKVQP